MNLVGIFYTIVAKGSMALIEHSLIEGDFLDIAKHMLNKITPKDKRKSLNEKNGEFAVHYIIDQDITFMCFSSTMIKLGVSYEYLESISKKFFESFDKKTIQEAKEKDPSISSFKGVLNSEMEIFGQLRGVDKLIPKTEETLNDKDEGIFYFIVAKGDIRLIDHQTLKGDYFNSAKFMMNKIPSHNQRISFKEQSKNFCIHYIVEEELTFMCFATLTHKIGVCYEFLEKAMTKFIKRYNPSEITDPKDRDPKFYEFENKIIKYLGIYGKVRKDTKIVLPPPEEEEIIKPRPNRVREKVKSRKPVMISKKREDPSRKRAILEDLRRDLEKQSKKFKWVIYALLVLAYFYLVFAISCGWDFGCLAKD